MSKKTYIFNGIETNYEIFDNGCVYSKKYDKFLKPYKTKGGYMNIDLYIDGVRYKKGIHQLVAEMFIPNPDNKPTVNHKNWDTTDNDINNLEWATYTEQNYHAHKNPSRKKHEGSKVHFANNNEEIIDTVCKYLVDGYTPLEVSEITKVPVKDIYEVRNKHTWKHVSCKYTFPKSRPIRNINISLKLREEAEKLLIEGYKVKDVCRILNIPDDKKSKKVIHDLKYNLKKAQRLTDNNKYYRIVINV